MTRLLVRVTPLRKYKLKRLQLSEVRIMTLDLGREMYGAIDIIIPK